MQRRHSGTPSSGHVFQPSSRNPDRILKSAMSLVGRAGAVGTCSRVIQKCSGASMAIVEASGVDTMGLGRDPDRVLTTLPRELRVGWRTSKIQK